MLEKLVPVAATGPYQVNSVSDYIHEKLFVTRKEDGASEDIRSEYSHTAA